MKLKTNYGMVVSGHKEATKAGQEILKKGGNNYWGDFLILQLIKEFLNINIIILYNNDISKKYYFLFSVNYLILEIPA